MAGRTGRRGTSVFLRYALSYTLIIVLIFLGLTLYLVHETELQVIRDTAAAQVNRLTRIALQHENAIAAMQNTAEEIGLSPNMEPFNYRQEPWKAYQLQLQLIPYTAVNDFCDQLYLTFAEDDRVYSSSSAMTIPQFTRLMQYESVSAERLTDLLTDGSRLTVLPAQRITSTLVDGPDLRMATFILPLGTYGGTARGTVLFLVKEQTYEALFSDAIDQPMNTYIFQGENVVAAAEDLTLTAEEARLLPEQEAYRIFDWQGERWMTISLSDRSWGMQYTTALRMADINSAIQLSVGRIAVMLVLLAGVALLLILWMSRRHARPIEELSSLLPSQPEANQDALSHLSTGIQQLTSRLEQALPMQRHDFVFRFIKGRFDSPEAAMTAASAIGLPLKGKPFYAVILRSVPAEEDPPADMAISPFPSLQGCTAAGAELVAMNASLFLAFAEKKETLPEFAECLRKRGSDSGDDSGIVCITAISAVHEDWAEAPGAYLEAAAAYENRFAMGFQRVLAYEEMPSDVSEILPKAQKITTAISQAISISDRELLDSRLSELLNFLRNTRMSPFAFRMIYNDVINRLTRGSTSRLADGSGARDYYDIFHLASCQSIDDLDEMLRGLCDSLMADNREADQAQPSGEDEMTLAARYMQEHFAEPELSMTAIAESLGMSTARLSLSFREKMGMTPSDYLALLRCDRARELLTTTEMTIREISGQVGYYDPGSFIRRFKQVTGETPLQYRRNHTPRPENEEGLKA